MFIYACAYFSNLLCIVRKSFGIGINEKIKDFRKGLNLLNPGLCGSPCRSFCLLIDSLRCFAALEICLLYGTPLSAFHWYLCKVKHLPDPAGVTRSACLSSVDLMPFYKSWSLGPIKISVLIMSRS